MVREIIQLKPDEIEVSGQVRKTFPEASLQEMADSLRQIGLMQPVVVQRVGDRYRLISGERRLRGTQLAGLSTIDAIVEEADFSSGDVRQRQLIENVQREGLPPLELANGIKELMAATGWSASEVAAKLGLSAATVSRSLALLRLPEAIQSQVGSGIAASAAYELGKIADPAQQAELFGDIINGGLNRDAISSAVKRKISASAETDGKPSTRAKAELGGNRSITLAGPGLDSLDSLIGWLDELIAKARKARPKGHALGTFLRILKDEAKGVT